jgi:uncharacterized protein (TIGR00730 family)
MKRITVFCGSSIGTDEAFKKEAILLGETLAKQHIGLVYGGAKVGIMGAVADGVLSAKGHVIGVIPQFLRTKEVAHDNITELITVKTMHERKTKMHELCDGVIALPGGFGTMEELFEMLTWAQLGLHQKPIGLLNTNGFYNDLIHLITNMVDKGFLKQINQDMLIVSETVTELLKKMSEYKAPDVDKWMTNETT